MGFESVLIKGIMVAAFLIALFLIIPTKKDPDEGNPEVRKIFTIVNHSSIISRTEKTIVLGYRNGNDTMRDAKLLVDAGFKGSINGVELTVLY